MTTAVRILNSATPRADTRSIAGTTQLIDVGIVLNPDPHVNPYLARGYLDNAGEIAWLTERSERATRQALADTAMAEPEGGEFDDA